ncbi:unnamed protein product, partial [Coregonus sp. 'balchen']
MEEIGETTLLKVQEITYRISLGMLQEMFRLSRRVVGIILTCRTDPNPGGTEFAHTFHPFNKKNPQVTEKIHKQFIKDLQRTIQ